MQRLLRENELFLNKNRKCISYQRLHTHPPTFGKIRPVAPTKSSIILPSVKTIQKRPPTKFQDHFVGH